MLPVIFIASTVFLSLTLIRVHLSHTLLIEENATKIQELESQLARARKEQRIARERERRARERILPMVVERVLQKVGVRAEGEDEEVVAEDERLLV